MLLTARLRSAWTAFAAWRRRRPFVGGLLSALAGVEMFLSSQLDLGHIRVQLGLEGFQATIIPFLLVLLGVLAVLTPAQRIFFGIVVLALGVYALVGVNLGGFFVGTLLAAVGGVLVVAWAPRAPRADQDDEPPATAAGPPADGLPGNAPPRAEPRPFARSRG